MFLGDLPTWVTADDIRSWLDNGVGATQQHYPQPTGVSQRWGSTGKHWRAEA